MTVKPKKSDRSSGTWATPERAMRWGGRPFIECPKSRMSPPSRGRSPETVKQRRGLARAVGAEQRDHLAFGDDQVELSDHRHAVIAGVELVDLEQRSAHGDSSEDGSVLHASPR